MTNNRRTPPLVGRTESIWPAPTRPPAGSEALPDRADVVVVGAGIAGMACARQLRADGLDVVVVDAVDAGAGTTGRSSAKVSIVHELHAHEIAGLDGLDTARNYLHANQYGLDWIADQVEQNGIECNWERRAGITYVTTPENTSRVVDEVRVFESAGIAARQVSLDLPFETQAAIQVDDQAQFDPVRFVDGLVASFRDEGGTFVAGIRATGVNDGSSGATVHTNGGDIDCRWVVTATGLPFLDRGLFFARTEPKSSYVLACDVERLPDDGMYLSADGPTRSLRTAVVDGRRLLLVGGEGHKTGQGGDTRSNYERLATWTHDNFGLTQIVSRFSAHDYTTPDHRPFVGPIRPGRTSTLVATGFNKWGFTNAAAGAKLIRNHILDEPAPDWAPVYSTRRVPVSNLTDLASANANVGAHVIGGWVDALRRHATPDRQEGRVTRRRARPVAVSVDDDGHECAVSGVCTHLGGIVAWNPAEQTWDCPLHGSRFERAGTMLHGPAVSGLDG